MIVLGIFHWLFNPRIPLGTWADDALNWLTTNGESVWDAITEGVQGSYEGLHFVLSSPPYWVMVLVFAAIAYFASGWKVAIYALVGFWLIESFGQWDNSMMTLSLIILAVFIALVISIPVGILAARNRCVSGAARPLMDLMQTTPAMVYLVPTILLFSVGQTPGAVATIIFSMPPGVRLTELAIRQVDQEVVEAGQAFGSSPRRILRQIQIPLAMPTIMAGVNQVIMLALSMVVIAGMAGADGLGKAVYTSLDTLDTPLGVEAGLSVVLIAVYLDRVTSGLGNRRSS